MLLLWVKQAVSWTPVGQAIGKIVTGSGKMNLVRNLLLLRVVPLKSLKRFKKTRRPFARSSFYLFIKSA